MQNITYGFSDTKPPQYYYSAGLIQFLCNVKQIEIVDIDGGLRSVWRYDYVDMPPSEIITKEQITTSLDTFKITTTDIITDISVKIATIATTIDTKVTETI